MTSIFVIQWMEKIDVLSGFCGYKFHEFVNPDAENATYVHCVLLFCFISVISVSGNIYFVSVDLRARLCPTHDSYKRSNCQTFHCVGKANVYRVITV